MSIYKWFLELPYIFIDIGNWLTEPLHNFNGDPIIIGGIPFNMLAVFSVGVLTAIVVAKLIALLIPN